MLTEQGLTNVFRVVGRDDVEGSLAAELLAERWGNQPIAILHDGEPYGKGLADETKKLLNARGQPLGPIALKGKGEIAVYRCEGVEA
jgi:branched-chain amino acid transport system substrate-binding protein